MGEDEEDEGEPLESLRRTLARSRPDLVVPRRIGPAGGDGPTRRTARTRWRRCYAGLYVPREVDPVAADQRIVEAAAAVAGHPAALGGWAALTWRGARWWSGVEDGLVVPVPITIATFDRRHQAGIELRAEPLPPDEVEVLDGVRTLRPVRAVADELRRAPSLRRAVRTACMAAYDDLVSADDLLAHAATCGPRTGVGRVRDAARLMSENCWSPREAETLHDWVVHAGLPPLLANQPVFDLGGRHLGTPDLLDVEAGLVVEYDGLVHLDPARRREDVRRDARLRAAGLAVVTIVAGMGLEERCALFRTSRAQAARRPITERRWTATPPDWWVSTSTVAARRRLSEEQRDRLLRYRAA